MAFETGGTLHTGGFITNHEHALHMVYTFLLITFHLHF